MDINPFNHGHALIISKRHAANVHEIDDDSIAAVARTARRIAGAVEDAVKPDGINIVQANGPGAAQSVLHYHVHVLPRRLGEIGRASCRERVWQSGLISVVAVSLKKKQAS